MHKDIRGLGGEKFMVDNTISHNHMADYEMKHITVCRLHNRINISFPHLIIYSPEPEGGQLLRAAAAA